MEVTGLRFLEEDERRAHIALASRETALDTLIPNGRVWAMDKESYHLPLLRLRIPVTLKSGYLDSVSFGIEHGAFASWELSCSPPFVPLPSPPRTISKSVMADIDLQEIAVQR